MLLDAKETGISHKHDVPNAPYFIDIFMQENPPEVIYEYYEEDSQKFIEAPYEKDIFIFEQEGNRWFLSVNNHSKSFQMRHGQSFKNTFKNNTYDLDEYVNSSYE